MGPFTVGQIPSLPQAFNVSKEDKVTPWDLSVYDTINMIVSGPDDITIPGSAMGIISPVGSPNNLLILDWNSTTSPFVEVGIYRYQFELIGPGNIKEYTGVGIFEVEDPVTADATTLWCTLNDVLQITGQAVTQDQLQVAQYIIDTVTNRTPANIGRIKLRDIGWLRRALAYQAVWMQSQPDMFTRASYEMVSQDGFSGKLTSKGAVFLGPLADRTLRNLSWKRTRSLRMENAFIDGDYATDANPLSDAFVANWEKI